MPVVKLSTGRLDAIDWDFPQAGTEKGSIHKLHWFPGNFIPQIPAALIQVLSVPGEVVLDPFGGSGTTVMEAVRLNRRGIYADSVSACVFVAKAKVAAATNPMSERVKVGILNQLTWDHVCFSHEVGQRGEGSDKALDDWYAPRTLAQLRYLWNIIEGHVGDERAILELIFSDLLFACASTAGSQTLTGKTRRHHWGWVADNVCPKSLVEHDAIFGFRTRLFSLPLTPVISRDHLTLLKNDARELPLVDSSVDLIVTSPPYIGVIDYVKANRMLYLWMNWPFEADRTREIGARFKRQRRGAAENYLTDIAACWREFCRVLKPGGRCAVVIGGSRAFPGVFDQALAMLNEMLPIVWGPVERTPTRRRVADRAARESREVICVAQKS